MADAELSDVEAAKAWLRMALKSLCFTEDNIEWAAINLLDALTGGGRAKLVRREPTLLMKLAGGDTEWRAMFEAAPPYSGE